MPEEFNNGADVAEVPAPADLAGSGPDTQPDNLAGQPEATARPSIMSLLQKAQESTARSDDDPSGDDEPNEDESEAESDEQIPDDDAEDEESDEEESQPAEDENEPDQDQPKRDRTQAYKDIKAENLRITTESAAITEKLGKLDAQFKKYGGVDIVETAMETIEKLATGKAVEVFETLPDHERVRVQQTIFEQAITDHSNRVFGINHVLKTDFGLSEALNPELIEKAFEFITYRINDAGTADFEGFLDRELEFANTPERELARTKAELERIKNPKQVGSQDQNAEQETELQIGMRVETAYRDFHDTSFKKIADAEFEAYGLSVRPTDPQSIKDGKETLYKALEVFTDQQMRGAKAFEPLIPYWVNGKTTDKYFQLNVRQYETALKANVQAGLKKISKLFGKPQTAPSKDGAADLGKKNTTIPATNGKSALQPTSKPRTNEPIGMKGAFNAALKATRG